MNNSHTSVLLQGAIDALCVREHGLYIDGTHGEGGHSREIICRGGAVLGIDLDPSQCAKHDQQLYKVVHGSYKDIAAIAQKMNFIPVDGILLDLGLSMEQIKHSSRGFSYKNADENLDMRIDPSSPVTASDILARYDEQSLTDLFMRYAEDVHSAKLARGIIIQRKKHPIRTVSDLLTLIIDVVFSGHEVGQEVLNRYAARIFQALRIEVNDEMQSIEGALEGSLAIVQKGGRVVTITFHSIEDRLVKRWIRLHRTKVEEIHTDTNNHRSEKYERSAHLRVFEIV